MRRVTALIPDVQAEIVQEAGHGLNLERPELVNERLLRFIDGGRSQPAG
ncbi:hypothetical protein [Kitasatospora kazusensis]